MKFFLTKVSKYKEWIFFLFLLLLFFIYLDEKIMLFLKNLKLNYPETYAYIKILNKFLEKLYQGFIVCSIGLSLYYLFSKNQREKGIKISLTIIIVGILSQVKYLLGRARPKITYQPLFTGPSKDYAFASFPSGHTFFIFAMANVYSHLYPKYKIVFYTLAIFIALERLLSFAHFPSDIIAGAFLGIWVSNIIIKRSKKCEH